MVALMNSAAKRRLRLSDAVHIAPVGIDHLSAVRYIHETSFCLLAAGEYSEEEKAGYLAMLKAPAYARSMLTNDLVAAWYGDHMVGTAGWCPGTDTGTTARLRMIFVAPMFAGAGIGRLLVETVEARAVRAGFLRLSARSTLNSAGFYHQLGYRTKGRGLMQTADGPGLPVMFLHKVATQPTARIRAVPSPALV